jgi:putative endonuclease
MNRKKTGSYGESIAATYLKNSGHKVLHCNFATRRGELDLISLNSNGVLTLTEVKTDQTQKAGDPASWVNSQKVNQLHKMGQEYCNLHNVIYQEIQFDVITIILEQGESPKLNHIPNAFLPNCANFF